MNNPLDLSKVELPLAKRPFQTWTLNQFLEYNPPPDQIMLGAGYLQRGQWTSLVGVGGLGKTRMALFLSLQMIMGNDWLGIATHCRNARVLFLSTENGATRWKHDLVKMTKGMAPTDIEIINKSLFILSLEPSPDDPEDADPSLNMSDPVAVGRLTATITATDPDLIIVDPLADMVGGDENSAEAMGDCIRTIRRCQRIAAPRSAGLIIHHGRTGAANIIQAGDNFNAGNFGRGSKALYGAIRCEIQMTPGDKEDNTRLVVACGKSNDAPKFPMMGVVFDQDTFTYFKDETWSQDEWRACVMGQQSGLTLADMLNAIKGLFSGHGCEVKATDISVALAQFDPSESTLKRRLREAVAAGYLRRGERGFYGLGNKPFPKQK